MLPGPINKTKFSSHFEALFEHANMGILITDVNGRITAINPFALNEFGYSEVELTGKKVEILIPSRFHKKHAEYHTSYFKYPQIRPMGVGRELVALKKDGTEFPVEISLSYYQHDGNKFVIAFVSDITARKNSESEIEKLNDELEATIEQRTKDLRDTLNKLEIANDNLEEAISYQKAIVDNAGAMIIATDENGIIKIFNLEAVHNIGYDVSEIIDKHTPVLFHDKAEIARGRKELLQEFGINIENDFDVLTEKARRNIHAEDQYSYIRKNGTSFPVLLTINSIKNYEGIITGFLGIAVDISERKRVEENLRSALEKERDLGELKSRFVSMASHEFRTPLSTILSSAYLIEKYTVTEDQSKREKHIQRVISSVNMLTDILNDFLSVGKIEEGKMHVKLSNFNIQELIEDIASEIKNTLKRQQKLNCSHEGDPLVTLDASLVKHIVMNLISNASKFSSESSPVEVRTVTKKDHVILSVKDQGIGISKEDQKHLMERFFRGANATNIQGTGLGLHIVSKYAELMNGTVECKSVLEKGSEFIITFHNKKSTHEENFTDRR